MAYAATPVAAPLPDAPMPAEEGKAPPTIDSHGGKLTPMSHCYPDLATQLLLLVALLLTFAPRRLGRLNFGWTRLAPGVAICALVLWNLFQTGPMAGYPGMDEYLRVRTLHLVGLLVFATLNLLADLLTTSDDPAPARGLGAMAATALGLLVLLGLTLVDWHGRTPVFSPSVDGMGYLAWTIGVPVGVGLLFLWRRYDGRLFDVALLVVAVGSLFVVGAQEPGPETAWIGLQLVAFTVAAGLGAGLRAMGMSKWQGLTGRAAWAWAWILRCTVIAMGVC
jgi:hypothetical protein